MHILLLIAFSKNILPLCILLTFYNNTIIMYKFIYAFTINVACAYLLKDSQVERFAVIVVKNGKVEGILTKADFI